MFKVQCSRMLILNIEQTTLNVLKKKALPEIQEGLYKLIR